MPAPDPTGHPYARARGRLRLEADALQQLCRVNTDPAAIGDDAWADALTLRMPGRSHQDTMCLDARTRYVLWCRGCPRAPFLSVAGERGRRIALPIKDDDVSLDVLLCRLLADAEDAIVGDFRARRPNRVGLEQRRRALVCHLLWAATASLELDAPADPGPEL